MAVLLVREKNSIIDKIPLYKDVFFIGRALENDLILTDTASSRRHTRIATSKKGYIIEDMASANGTYLNGRLIRSTEKLRDGDVVRIGDTELIYRDDDKKAAKAGQVPDGLGQVGDLGTSQIIKPISDIAPEMNLEKSIEDFSASLAQGRSSVAQAPPEVKAEKKKDTNFQILYKLGKILTSTSTLDELLDTGLKLVTGVIRADRGVLQTFDPETGKLKTRASMVKGELQPFAGKIDISSTISNKVITEKVAMMTADARSDPRFLEGQSIVAINICSALCVPLWDEENVRGIIYVDNLTETNTFTEDDLDLLAAVAHQIAVGIKKEELNEHIRHESVVRSNLERFHSKEELDMILAQGGGSGDASFSMQETVASVLFADICSFTPMSEAMRPTDVADMLNAYFTTMTKIIFKNKGSVNKYVGDGIIATFGAFSDADNGAENAVRAGCEMIAALKEMNKDPNNRFKFEIRVGVNTGPVVVGMLGPVERMEFTVLGDTVNVASRFESTAKPMSVCFGEATYNSAGAKFRVSQLGDTQLKGKASKASMYGILIENL